MKKPLYWVRLDFNEFYRMVMAPQTDAELAAWIREFSSTLFFGDGTSEYAKALRSVASNEHEKYSESGAKGAEARWRKQAENGNANGEANSEANSQSDGIREEKKREDNTIQEQTVQFEEFWSKYPKKIGKESASKIWSKMSQDDRRMAIGAIEPSTKGKEKKFIKQGDTYLRAKPWLDDEYNEKTRTETKVVSRISKVPLPQIEGMF